MAVPADIGNRALDAIGYEGSIGDLEEGTAAARPLLRAYGPGLRQLLRTAHWNFARKQAPMTLLADATGQTAGVGTIVPSPWIYEYALPYDSVKARFVPLNQQQTPTGPQFTGSFPIVQGPPSPGTMSMTGLNVITPNNVRLVPARFLVTLDFNYPVTVGAITDWSQDIEIQGGGFGPQQRTVVLTNVKNASLIYTALVTYPDEWDALFQQAFVQLLAERVALTLTKDKRLGLTLRTQAMLACKEAIGQARVTDGNEGWTTVDHTPDWLRARNAGGYWNENWGWQDGGGWPGVMGYGWDAMSFGDGSAF